MSRLFNGTSGDTLDNTNPAITVMPGAGFTLSAWVKFNSVGASQNIFTLGQAAVNANRWTLNTSATDFVQAQARDASTAALSSTTLPVVVGGWQLCTAVFTSDSSRASLLNGGAKGVSGVSKPITSPTNTHVSGNPVGANPVDGLMAHLAVWNTALSDSDVLALMTSLPSAIQPANLLEYWPLRSNQASEPSYGTAPHILTVTGTTFSTDDPYPNELFPYPIESVDFF